MGTRRSAKALLHNETIRQPLVIELGENETGIPMFDAMHEAEAFLSATVLGSNWEAVELPDVEAANVLEGFSVPIGALVQEDEHDKAISRVILNPPPHTRQEGGADVGTYLVALLEYARTLRTQGRYAPALARPQLHNECRGCRRRVTLAVVPSVGARSTGR